MLSGVGDGLDQVERALTEASFASKVEKERSSLLVEVEGRKG